MLENEILEEEELEEELEGEELEGEELEEETLDEEGDSEIKKKRRKKFISTQAYEKLIINYGVKVNTSKIKQESIIDVTYTIIKAEDRKVFSNIEDNFLQISFREILLFLTKNNSQYRSKYGNLLNTPQLSSETKLELLELIFTAANEVLLEGLVKETIIETEDLNNKLIAYKFKNIKSSGAIVI